jgi:alkanesulfonate monooxygenase SsuD/methylene tetrahydromethanopterin reductase-like flavin-dependent oxidoreductase (luciferase family)
MKFGYFVRNTVFNYPEVRNLSVKVDNLGFESIHVNDHFLGMDVRQDRREPMLEALMLLSALAVETKKVKLGQIVLCNSFRNPAYLAKIISTLDNISNGRALLWIGAGWFEEEYKAYGYPFPSPKRRVDELEESLKIYKKIFTEEVTDFEGRFWNLVKLRNFPKPVQKPYPQLVIGTTGKRMIDIACREADGVNLDLWYTPNIEGLPPRISYIYDRLKKYNRDPAQFEISLFTAITIVESQEKLDDLVGRMMKNIPKNQNITKDDILNNRYVGFPEDLKEKMIRLEDMGIKKIVTWIRRSDFEDSISAFSEKVM